MSSATMIPVDTSPIAKLTIVTTTSMMFIALRNCPAATAQIDGGGSLVISFGPCWPNRIAASPALSPDVASLSSAATTAVASIAYGNAAVGFVGSSCSSTTASASTTEM